MQKLGVIVTGGGRGIGREVALQCLASGHVVISADLKFENPLASVTEVVGDVCDQSTVDAVFSLAKNLKLPLALVNAAGVSIPETGSYSLKSWQMTIDTNLTAVFKWCEHYRELVASAAVTGAAIVNIGSLASHRAFADNPSYLASKTGVLGLTRAYALELSSHGVRVNSVSPGYIRTEMTSLSWNDESLRAQRADSSLLGRWGEPIDVALVCRFLLSDDSRFVTGVDIPVDGGWLAKG